MIDDASLIQKIRDYWAYHGYRVKVWVETAGGVSGCIRSNMINGKPQKRDRILDDLVKSPNVCRPKDE
jgi:hypothetical protein